MILLHLIAGIVHRARHGHIPVWYDLGTNMTCLQCLGGGGNARQRMPVLAGRPL